MMQLCGKNVPVPTFLKCITGIWCNSRCRVELSDYNIPHNSICTSQKNWGFLSLFFPLNRQITSLKVFHIVAVFHTKICVHISFGLLYWCLVFNSRHTAPGLLEWLFFTAVLGFWAPTAQQLQTTCNTNLKLSSVSVVFKAYFCMMLRDNYVHMWAVRSVTMFTVSYWILFVDLDWNEECCPLWNQPVVCI